MLRSKTTQDTTGDEPRASLHLQGLDRSPSRMCGARGSRDMQHPPLTNKILPVLNFYFLRRRPNLLYFSGGILGLHKAFRNHFLMSLNLLASFSVHRNIANMSLWLGSHFPDRSLSHWNGLQIGSGTDLRYPEYRHTGFCRDIIYPKWYS